MSKIEPTVSHAILVLKQLYQQQHNSNSDPALSTPSVKKQQQGIVSSLARRFDTIRHPAARACVLWLVGQYSGAIPGEATAVPGIHDWAPDVLRSVAKSYLTEVSMSISHPQVSKYPTYHADGSKSEQVQLQALTLAAKLLVLSFSVSGSTVPLEPQKSLSPSPTQTVHLLTQYVFSQAAIASTSYDVRDRARSLGALIRGISPVVYRASVSTYTFDQLYDDAKVTGDSNNDVEVTTEEWDRQARALRSMAPAAKDDGVEDDDNIDAGGVTLRVEQARLVLFEGKIVASSPSTNGGRFSILTSVHRSCPLLKNRSFFNPLASSALHRQCCILPDRHTKQCPRAKLVWVRGSCSGILGSRWRGD